MFKRVPGFLLICLGVSLVIPSTGRAQQTTLAVGSSFAAGTYEYKGTANWQEPDGTAYHGTALLDVVVTINADKSSAIETQASFSFDVLGNGTTVGYNYLGSLDAGGLSYLRLNSEGINPVNEGLALPALNLGRMPLLLNPKHTVANGGAQAADGTQFTFRATLKKIFPQ